MEPRLEVTEPQFEITRPLRLSDGRYECEVRAQVGQRI